MIKTPTSSSPLLALSIVAPSGGYIADGRKTLEVRSWRPDEVPLRDLLIVENHKFLTAPGDSDPNGRAVALVDVIEVRPWLEGDVEAACARKWAHGYWAWVLSNVRPIAEVVQLAAERRLYRAAIAPTAVAALLNPKTAT